MTNPYDRKINIVRITTVIALFVFALLALLEVPALKQIITITLAILALTNWRYLKKRKEYDDQHQ